MRKFLILTLTPTLPALLAAALLAGCGGGGGSPAADRSAGERTTTTAAADAGAAVEPASSASEATPEPRPAAATDPAADQPASSGDTATPSPGSPAPGTADPAPAPDGRRYLCPEGGIDAVRQLQDAVDQGHQPWRLSAEDVAAGCTFGAGASTVEPAGSNRFRVTETATGDQLLVTVDQPLGPSTIWAVTAITPA